MTNKTEEFTKAFVRWWEEAGQYFYSEGKRDEDEGLQMLAEQARTAINGEGKD